LTSPRHDIAETIAGLLHDWLPHQRWFGGKQREISDVRPVQWRTLLDRGPDGPRLDQLVVAVEQHSGRGLEEALYQLLVGLRPFLPERLEYARIGAFDRDGTHVVAYDASYDGDLMKGILELISADAEVDGVRFQPENGVPVTTGLTSRPIIAEQSNTSVIFSDEYILKLFRKIHRGLSPDVELHRALRRVGSKHIAEPYGVIEGELDGEPVSYGILQRYFANCADGWAMALTSVRDLIAEADLHADEVGGDFAAESQRLGQAVAAVHDDLAEALGTELVPPDEVHTVVERMNSRLDVVVDKVAELAPYRDEIRAAFAEITELGEPVRIQRIHGDLHLGQALRTIQNWVIIDFEGEPARPLSERVQKMTPLRDVAGMLRSFDYAAHHLLVDYTPAEAYESESQLEYRAKEWADRNRAAFCDGYASGGVDPREHPVLLRALELEKAVYEVGYEYDNRPSWIDIPLRSIARLTGTPAR
jgi:maltokinase